MYYRNYEGFEKLTKEEKAEAKKEKEAEQTIKKAKTAIDKLKGDEKVKKFISAQCTLTELDNYDMTEVCPTSISSPF